MKRGLIFVVRFPITEAFRVKENNIWIAGLLAISLACIWSVVFVFIAKRISKYSKLYLAHDVTS